MGLYPTEEEITMFGEKLKFPGLKDGKFTNGSFTDPKQLASFIPAETLNLVLDNLEEFIRAVGLEPNNTNINQLAEALNIRTKYSVQKTTLPKLIKFYTEPVNTVIEKIPDEKGLIHSEDIDLRQKVAEQIGRNKEDIRILNWNLSTFSNNSGSKIMYSHFSIAQDGYVALPSFSPFNLRIFETPNISKRYNFYLFVQIADNLSDSITAYDKENNPFSYFGDCCWYYKATGWSVDISMEKLISSTVNIWAFPFTSIEMKGSSKAQSSVEAFEYVSTSFLNNKENSFTVDCLSNIYCRIFFGDEIKVRIRLIGLDKIYTMLNTLFDVDVRYIVINK